MPSNDDVVRLLASIDRRLALLAADEERALQQALKADLLSTEARAAMFYAIDGEREGGELGRLAGVSDRSGQLFVKELLGLGLVREVQGTNARAVVVERDEGAIVQWYLKGRSAG